jgi:hypothetical protein
MKQRKQRKDAANEKQWSKESVSNVCVGRHSPGAEEAEPSQMPKPS